MSASNLTDKEALLLIAMEKRSAADDVYDDPWSGEALTVPLESLDGRESFLLDINRKGRINLKKVTYQNRARQVVVLVRVDLHGPPHRNPDGEEIPCPHLHVYREGYGTKWAKPLPEDSFSDSGDTWRVLQDFLRYCNVIRPPRLRRRLFP